MYDLLLGGLLSATLVPLFSSFIETEDDEVTNVVITISATLMLALTIVAVVAAPLIFRVYTLNPAGGRRSRPVAHGRHAAGRIFLIQILFYGLTGLANAFLNSRRRFFGGSVESRCLEHRHHRDEAPQLDRGCVPIYNSSGRSEEPRPPAPLRSRHAQ